MACFFYKVYFIKWGRLCIVFVDGNKCIVSGGGKVKTLLICTCWVCFFVVCVLCNPGSGVVCSLYF